MCLPIILEIRRRIYSLTSYFSLDFFNFENSFKALKESLFNLEDDLNKLKSQLPDFANQNVSLNLAGIFFPNETDLNTYYRYFNNIYLVLIFFLFFSL